MKIKCVAILGELFLKTNEVSLEINGCIDNTRVSDTEADAHARVDKMIVSNQMKSNVPFDFVISRSTWVRCFSDLIFVTVSLSVIWNK